MADMRRIEKLREIVATCTAAKVEGRTVDLTTAVMLVTVYDALTSDAAKAKFLTMPLPRVVEIGWECVA